MECRRFAIWLRLPKMSSNKLRADAMTAKEIAGKNRSPPLPDRIFGINKYLRGAHYIKNILSASRSAGKHGFEGFLKNGFQNHRLSTLKNCLWNFGCMTGHAESPYELRVQAVQKAVQHSGSNLQDLLLGMQRDLCWWNRASVEVIDSENIWLMPMPAVYDRRFEWDIFT